MQSQNRVLDDLARVASGAIGVAAGMREEIEARFREQFERVLSRMDVVSREEFEVVRAMAVAAREEQETLSARVQALEDRLAEQETAKSGPAKARRSAGRSKAKPGS